MGSVPDRSRWRRVAGVAAQQHGAVTAAQLVSLGITRASIARAVARGVLHRVLFGVYAVGHPALSRRGRWMAGVLARGEGAALADVAAAQLWDITSRRSAVISVVTPTWFRARDGVSTRRCVNLEPGDVVTLDGIPVTSVTRTIIDLARCMSAPELARIMHEAAYHDLLDMPGILTRVERMGPTRTSLSAALYMHMGGSAGSRSRPESVLALALARHAVDAPFINVVRTIAGRRFELDFAWPDLRLDVEVDGPGHARPAVRAADMARDEHLRSAGWTVIRLPSRVVVEDATGSVRIIAEALEGLRGRPSSGVHSDHRAESMDPCVGSYVPEASSRVHSDRMA